MFDELKALAVFARTVERGSFRGAAAALGLSPSVVSQHVTSLERKLGVQLLYRSTRHLALTPEGERLFLAAREAVAIAERGFDAVRGGDVPAGKLRLTAPAVLAETPFCAHLAAFLEAHPGVSLTVGFSELRRDLLRDDLDLALRMGRLEDSTLVAKRLASMQRTLVASPRHAARRPAPQSPEDLVGWPFAHLAALPPTLSLVGPTGELREVALEPRISVDSAVAIREIARAGLGIGVIPTLLARESLAAGELVELLAPWRPPEVPVFAVWPPGTTRPALTLRFLDFLEPRLRADLA